MYSDEEEGELERVEDVELYLRWSDCPWQALLHQHHRTYLGTLLLFAGVLCSSCLGWLVSSASMRMSRWSRSQALLVNTCSSALLRCLLSGFPFLSTSALSGRWLFGWRSCRALGFLRHFFGLAELFSLALQTSERVIIVASDRNPGNKFVIFSVSVCWLLAFVCSMFPFFGIGRVDCDLSCVSCGLDWRPVRGVQFWYNTVYMIVAISLPIVFIYSCLVYIWTSTSPVQSQKQAEERQTTKAVTLSVMLWMLFNVPSALVTFLVVFRYEDSIFPPIIIAAHISPEICSTLPVICFLCLDSGLREALLCPNMEQASARQSAVEPINPDTEDYTLNKLKNRRHNSIPWKNPFSNTCCCC